MSDLVSLLASAVLFAVATVLLGALIRTVRSWLLRSRLRRNGVSSSAARDPEPRKVAQSERELNTEARLRKYGSSRFAPFYDMVSGLLCLATLRWADEGHAAGQTMLVYLIVGLVVVSRHRLERHRSWPRLGPLERFWFRVTYAWLWPLLIAAKSRRPADGAGDC